jgi:nicotinate-nucleotide pyrophosphorylase (carboxylating)
VLDLNALPLPDLFAALIADGSLDRLLEAAVREDLGDAGDVTTACMIGAGWPVRAECVPRRDGVVAGIAAVAPLLEAFQCPAGLEVLAGDGERCAAGRAIVRLHGALGPILGAERTLLNLVGRLGGIATLTSRFVERVAGTRAAICDTRKTAPGLRALDKYAVRCGGGTLHRLGLHDAVLLKDNHLAHLAPEEFLPAVTRAVERARARHALRFVEVEADTLEQLEKLLAAPPGLVDAVLLDNMPPDRLRMAVALRDRRAPRLRLEASGGITLETVRQVAETGVDRISVGALTHSAPWLDVGLDVG